MKNLCTLFAQHGDFTMNCIDALMGKVLDGMVVTGNGHKEQNCSVLVTQMHGRDTMESTTQGCSRHDTCTNHHSTDSICWWNTCEMCVKATENSRNRNWLLFCHFSIVLVSNEEQLLMIKKSKQEQLLTIFEF